MAGAGGLTEAVAAVRRLAAVPTGPLVVALSGGADSAVCAWAAVEGGEEVRAIFVDHGFPESAQLAGAARAVASHLGIPLSEIGVSVPQGPSPEGQARAARHAALEDALRDGETLLSGHTADDQAETVLGNLLRGAGATGLAGIPQRRGRWARPLLGIDRATVREAADALELPYVDDPTNSSLDARRNRLRHEALPALRSGFNPQLTAALTRSAAHAAADDRVLEARAGAVPMVATGSLVKVPAAALTVLPSAVATRVVRRALRAARGPYPGDAGEVEVILGAAAGTAGTIGGSVRVAREGPWVVIGAHDRAVPEPVDLRVPGETRFWAGTIVADTAHRRWKPLGPQVTRVEPDDSLQVMAAAPDDRIAIGGGSKTIGDALAEAGIAPRLRSRWPAVSSRGIIRWIVGVRSEPLVAGADVTLTASLEER